MHNLQAEKEIKREPLAGGNDFDFEESFTPRASTSTTSHPTRSPSPCFDQNVGRRPLPQIIREIEKPSVICVALWKLTFWAGGDLYQNCRDLPCKFLSKLLFCGTNRLNTSHYVRVSKYLQLWFDAFQETRVLRRQLRIKPLERNSNSNESTARFQPYPHIMPGGKFVTRKIRVFQSNDQATGPKLSLVELLRGRILVFLFTTIFGSTIYFESLIIAVT